MARTKQSPRIELALTSARVRLVLSFAGGSVTATLYPTNAKEPLATIFGEPHFTPTVSTDGSGSRLYLGNATLRVSDEQATRLEAWLGALS